MPQGGGAELSAHQFALLRVIDRVPLSRPEDRGASVHVLLRNRFRKDCSSAAASPQPWTAGTVTPPRAQIAERSVPVHSGHRSATERHDLPLWVVVAGQVSAVAVAGAERRPFGAYPAGSCDEPNIYEISRQYR